MNLSGIDLNLMVALEALLQERSVTKAARRQGISQPAMSNTLRRLRELLDDPILVRGAGGMFPTPRALAMVDSLSRGLAELRTVIATARQFVPRELTRTFRVAVGDYLQVVLGPGLLERFQAEAPDARLALIRTDGALALSRLRSGACDLLLGEFGTQIDLEQQVLLGEGFLCLTRRGHPAVADGLDLETYVRLGHVLVTPLKHSPGVMDGVLAEHGLSRTIVATTAQFTGVPAMVARTDLIATLPARLARALSRAFDVELHEVPVDTPSFTVRCYWRSSASEDPEIGWLRGLLAAAAREIEAGEAQKGHR